MNVTPDILSKVLKELGLAETGKDPDGKKLKQNTQYFYNGGKEFIIYLSEEKYTGNKKIVRKHYLRNLSKEINDYFKKDKSLKNLRSNYKDRVPGSSTSAGGVDFSGSSGIRIVAKMFSVSGKKVNKGILFEENLEKDFKGSIEGKSKFIYNDFMDKFSATIRPFEIVSVRNVGSRNTPRPLGSDSKGVYVSVRGGGRKIDIGDAVVDIQLITKNPKSSITKTINLSAKYGNTVTFFNSGVTKVFTPDEFKKGQFKNPIAKGLIDLFKIDVKLFKGVFLNYVESEDGTKRKAMKEAVTVKVDTSAMKDFIKTVIGKGYTLVHEHDNRSVSFYDINDKFLEKASTLSSDKITIYYPKGGTAKRIDIHVETQVFHLNFNIRNKQSGILPSHIMCDYKFK